MGRTNPMTRTLLILQCKWLGKAPRTILYLVAQFALRNSLRRAAREETDRYASLVLVRYRANVRCTALSLKKLVLEKRFRGSSAIVDQCRDFRRVHLIEVCSSNTTSWYDNPRKIRRKASCISEPPSTARDASWKTSSKASSALRLSSVASSKNSRTRFRPLVFCSTSPQKKKVRYVADDSTVDQKRGTFFDRLK